MKNSPQSQNFILDLRYLEIEASLSDLLGLHKTQLKQMDIFIGKAQEDMLSCEDQDEFRLYQGIYEYTKDFIAPRFFLHGTILFAWSTYETIISTFARRLAADKHPKLKITPQKLKGCFLERIQLFFSDILKMPDIHSKEEWAFLEDVYKVRNAIAHENGDLTLMNDNTIEQLKKIDKNSTRFNFDGSHFIVAKEYTDEIISNIHRLLSEVFVKFKTELDT
ncbi:MAG: hypothetical protein KKD85_07795 [Proteobacteria bacterium]|uniref:RiboL-PSP-HEPN domain-containing protein n=2 Tax=Desulfovibrionaceae TaxID=194924 RepID=E6VYR1_PSEA9|nr:MULTISPECIES: hypothetical protein [Pseudodesulfovibrio]MBU4192208.1 hypothetical protein [Pseudomonadota bacterium]MCG2732207.1 hypothetical protein [Pseudodesulfovibrio aespoeensis]ADU63928.1 hypothetical protein Daes_2934 [Pseudodesulfovibrio aespoeensis Aspo-2]MBU4380222.1 hypothetical protein [Pseudomonadota bacterium]MBU4474402.1 hypothetical protein [Pseudomonadota bacterium]